MDQFPPPETPDLTLQLPRDLYYQAIHELCAGLPAVTASPEDRARRDNAAIAVVASLLPANGDKVTIATQVVAANAQAMECLRLARVYPGDPNFVAEMHRAVRQHDAPGAGGAIAAAARPGRAPEA
jgi:hypothetical protein